MNTLTQRMASNWRVSVRINRLWVEMACWRPYGENTALETAGVKTTATSGQMLSRLTETSIGRNKNERSSRISPVNITT